MFDLSPHDHAWQVAQIQALAALRKAVWEATTFATPDELRAFVQEVLLVYPNHVEVA